MHNTEQIFKMTNAHNVKVNDSTVINMTRLMLVKLNGYLTILRTEF